MLVRRAVVRRVVLTRAMTRPRGFSRMRNDAWLIRASALAPVRRSEVFSADRPRDRNMRNFGRAPGGWMHASILVVDDEPVVREALRRLLSLDGYDVAVAVSGDDALSCIPRQGFDVIVSDIRMPGLNGLQLLERLRAANPRVGVILVTAYADVDTAVEALRLGANDFLLKPFEMDDLRRSVERVLRLCQEADPGRTPRAVAARPAAQTLVGESPQMIAVRAHIARCATMPSNVLITGESGVGKELVAGAIHAASPRSEQPFIPVNCGAI